MKRPYQGIIPPLATPLTSHQELDVPALHRQLERVITGGVAGVFACGTTGEAPSLSLAFRQNVARETCRLTAGRVPVLVGIGDTCVANSLVLAEAAAREGAQAVVLTVPYYFPPSQAELESLARTVARESPLPVFLYNIPVYTKASFALTTVQHLTDVPQIVGLKDSSGDLGYFRAVCEIARTRPDWTVLMGTEGLLAEAIAAGGHGGVTGGALVWPRLFVDLCQAALAGETGRVAALQAQVLSLGRLYRISSHSAGVLKAIKCALSLLGVCDERPAEPMHAFDALEREQVRLVLVECGLLPPVPAP
jgi:dihydrodipicolinate synthase/N-acetylneuraminate lyase